MDKVYIGILSCALVFLLHNLLGKKKKKNHKGGLPSPRAIPFLGHLHLVKQPIHAALCRLAERHGPVFSLRLGSRSTVVVSSPASARECFTEHDVALADRPRIPSWRFVSMYFSMLAATSYGPHWRTLRRVAAVHLLSTQRVSSMSGVIAGEVLAMVRRLYRSATASPRVQLRRRLFELSLSVLMETIAHTKATRSEWEDTDMSVEAQEYRKVLDEINQHVGMASLYWDHLPVMRWLDVFGNKNEVVAAVSKRDVFLQQPIDAERWKLDDGGIGPSSEVEGKSMISVMFTLEKKEPQVYTDTMISGVCAVRDLFHFTITYILTI
ncbi:unnamed protein product [Triticum turgidum subsp. durum]|uniref:Uncharacterized protein n=1 Tax=Triticum turgidum subsp. durum TaxID=4567 RepID=A0A9R1PA19_TRITD|nr:unnamed protein product [Triticum turgidum subsp. durum]